MTIEPDFAAPMPKAKPKPPRSSAVLKPQAFVDSTAPTEEDEPAQSEAGIPRTRGVQNSEAAEPPAPQPAEPVPMTEPAATVDPPPVRFDPKSLVGLDEKATAHILGEPSWTEDVPPAKYWQYSTPSCVLRVFFFMDMTTQHFRALSYELTSSDDAPNVDERCFAQLLAQASSRQASDGQHLH